MGKRSLMILVGMALAAMFLQCSEVDSGKVPPPPPPPAHLDSTGPLSSPEALLQALHGRALHHFASDANWDSLTPEQQQEANRAWDTASSALDPNQDYRGRQVTWVLNLEGVVPAEYWRKWDCPEPARFRPESNAVFLARMTDDAGNLVVASFGAEANAFLVRLRRYDLVHLAGRIRDYCGQPEGATDPPTGAAHFGVLVEGSTLLPVEQAKRVGFLGIGVTAQSVVYVVDRSGSMLDKFDAVRNEILSSISHLDPNQHQFHVILFSTGPPREMMNERLVPALPQHKATAADFLRGVDPGGRTDPLPALERAFDVLEGGKGEGKVIFLLTDGAFPDNEKAIATIKERNQDKKVRIFTILYWERSKEAEEMMKRIAQENGGRYRYVEME